jgi:hypothetical protein
MLCSLGILACALFVEPLESEWLDMSTLKFICSEFELETCIGGGRATNIWIHHITCSILSIFFVGTSCTSTTL